MEKIFFDEQTYYLINGVLYDSDFLTTPTSISQKVLSNYYKNVDYKAFNQDELLDHLKRLKSAEFYNDCLKAIHFGFEKFSSFPDFCTNVLPIMTSCYRAVGQSQNAIDFCLKNKSLVASCVSVPLLTSLAAAYCDIGDYDTAKKYANRAYAIQGGSKNFQTELSLVYERIKKETNDK